MTRQDEDSWRNAPAYIYLKIQCVAVGNDGEETSLGGTEIPLANDRPIGPTVAEALALCKLFDRNGRPIQPTGE